MHIQIHTYTYIKTHTYTYIHKQNEQRSRPSSPDSGPESELRPDTAAEAGVIEFKLKSYKNNNEVPRSEPMPLTYKYGALDRYVYVYACIYLCAYV